jgi:hypothetical protein
MAWIDDRIWCHPKLAGLTDKAYRAYVNGIAYSSGMGTRGVLDDAQMKLIGARKREKNELISARLWNEMDTTSVAINDWDEHNSKRDERRAADRERKRLARAAERESERSVSAGQSADGPQDSPVDSPQDATTAVRRKGAGQSSGPARAEGSEGSEGSETVEEQPRNRPVLQHPAREQDQRGTGGGAWSTGEDIPPLGADIEVPF